MQDLALMALRILLLSFLIETLICGAELSAGNKIKDDWPNKQSGPMRINLSTKNLNEPRIRRIKFFEKDNEHFVRTGEPSNGNTLMRNFPKKQRRLYEVYYKNDPPTTSTANTLENAYHDLNEDDSKELSGMMDGLPGYPEFTNNDGGRAVAIASSGTWSAWGSWSPWGRCSRTCGGGIKLQDRMCIVSYSDEYRNTSQTVQQPNVSSNECIGLYKRYRLCNEQPCPEKENEDFRSAQCSSYDDKVFQGKRYNWEPYIGEDDECELNCKPIGLNYFATLNSSVIDGTMCKRPAEYWEGNFSGPAVCIEGICKAILHHGLIQGAFANNNTFRCGSVTCRPIIGIYNKAILPHGYIHITTIPAGAYNVTITELKGSINLLVLKTTDNVYVINGDKGISAPGTYQAAGATFEYTRNEDPKRPKSLVSEWITSSGFITKSLDLLVLVKDINPGIKYEYFLPTVTNNLLNDDLSDIDNQWNELDTPQDFLEDNKVDDTTPNWQTEKRKRKFNWKIIGFGTCSKSCGGGLQPPIFKCIRDSSTRFYPPRRCAGLEKPVLNENIYKCNTQPCPPYWHIGVWNDCSCHYGIGRQERNIRCVQEITSGIIIQVDSVACLEEKPEEKKACECVRPSKLKSSSASKVQEQPRTNVNLRGTQTTISTNVTQSRPNMQANDKNGVWLLSEWNNHCSADCGSGVEHRSIFCDRTPPHTDRCDLRTTPDTTRPCNGDRYCERTEWFTGKWGHCGGDCFNLVKKRAVFCLKQNEIVEDEECQGQRKPDTLKNCTISEVSYCKPRWHYSEWTECTRTCGGGTQRRYVKCLELDERENIMRESQNCKYAEREPAYGTCNDQKCPEMTVDPRVDLIQNDLLPSCIDEFPNCHLVIKARLCSLEYYQRNCCLSCTGY